MISSVKHKLNTPDNMQTILVTGGAGFIGSHTIRDLIKQNYNVICVDDFNDYYQPKLKKDRIKIFLGTHEFPLYKIDITNYEDLKRVFLENKIDKIIHLAARAGVRSSMKNPFIYQQVNILGTLNLLELAREFEINQFIFASSSSVYGNRDKVPFHEDDFVDKPISPYAATKKAGELLAHSYSHNYKLPVIGLRFFTVYGPWGRPDMFYYTLANKVMKNEPIDVYNYGKGLKRDFTYIDDITKGILATLDHDELYEIVNIGNNKPVELMKFINLLEEYLGREAKKNMLPMQPGDVMITYANIDKAKEKFNYQPTTTIETGLKRFVDWYKNYHEIV